MLIQSLSRNQSRPSPFSSRPNLSAQRWFGPAMVALATVVTTPLASSAQQADSTQSGHRIAVIDIARIFKELPAIKSEVTKVEADLKTFDAELVQRREDLKQSFAQLKTLKAGTADYARREEQIASSESKLRLDMARKKQELRDAEAKIYFENYRRIAAAVKTIATHNNLSLVLRFNSEQMSLEHSESVARGVMKNVVYHDSTIDMTEIVLRFLEQQAKNPEVASGSGVASPTVR